MQKTLYVFPIIGGCKIEHLMDNFHIFEIVLSAEQVGYSRAFYHMIAASFTISQCVLLLYGARAQRDTGNGTDSLCRYKSAGQFDKLPLPQAVPRRAEVVASPS